MDLSPDEVEAAFEAIFQGEATPAQMGAFLVALRMKGETPAEIAAAATVMRRRATPVRTPPGARGARHLWHRRRRRGDLQHLHRRRAGRRRGRASPSPSTATAASPPGAGAPTSSPRAACTVDAPVEVVERCLAEVRIGFLYAPALHGAMRHVGPVRREVGVRSIFNLLGPLANPARRPAPAARRLRRARWSPWSPRRWPASGRSARWWCTASRGSTRSPPAVRPGQPGSRPARYARSTLQPEDGGLKPVPAGALRGGTPEDNARLLARAARRDAPVRYGTPCC